MFRFSFIFFLLLSLLMGEGFLFSQNLMHYTSGEYNFSIQLPENWQRSDDLSNKKVALILLSEEGASVSVAFYKLKSIESVEFIENYEKSLNQQLYKVKLQEKGVIKSRDDEAPYLVYDFSKDTVRYKDKVCFYTRDKEIALITVSHTEADFHKLLPFFDKIFKSFTFETNQDRVEEVD